MNPLDYYEQFRQILTAENGLFGLGWGIALGLMYRFFSKKDAYDVKLAEAVSKHADELDAARAAYDKKIEEVQAGYAKDLRETHLKIQEMQSAHTDRISRLSDKRIDDFKSVTEDYNTLAESVLLALEKMTQAMSKPKR